MYKLGDRAPVDNPRGPFVAGLRPMPDERQRKIQTNLRKCGNQPAHKSMPAVVESPVSNFAHLLRAPVFTIDGGKDTIMPTALANEHKRDPFGNGEERRQVVES